MAELSLCMIVRDEEERLEQCLQSVKEAVDEIVIVDTGSKDRTKEIALRYTDSVYDDVWQDDFAAARNRAFSLASKPFILWMDADDVIDAQEIPKLIRLKQELNDQIDAVMMPYHYAFSSDGKASLILERERIVRRAAGFVFEGAVHEAMTVMGNVIHADVVVRHTGTHGHKSNRRNLAIYEKQIASGKKMTARDQYYYARELKNADQLEKAERAFAAFLEGNGWIENRIDAYIQRGECLQKLGRVSEAKRSLLLSFAEASPRAEALCALGACLMEEGELNAAVFWFESALHCRMPRESGAFVSPDAYGYIPLMQLCVCYDRMGEHRKAAQMNEQALLLHPDDEAANRNRAYFAGILQNAQTEAQNLG